MMGIFLRGAVGAVKAFTYISKRLLMSVRYNVVTGDKTMIFGRDLL